MDGGGGGARCVGAFDDGVADVRFLGSAADGGVAAACWDAKVHVFGGGEGGGACALEAGGPVLGCEAVDGGRAVAAASLDTSVYLYDIETGSRTRIGGHGDPGAVDAAGDIACGASAVRCARLGSPKVLVSGGWDGAMRVWDTRAAGAAALEVRLPGRCYGLDAATAGDLLVAVTGGRRLASFRTAYDVRGGGGAAAAAVDAAGPPSALPYQPRCVRVSPDGRSQAVAFLEGKVTIERTATAEGSTKAFTFKCHRRGNAVFPVNAVAFSPRCRSLVFTGGSDGLVCAWDFEKRKKIFQFAKFASSVSALDVS